MFEPTAISVWHWAGFIVFILSLLALDLGLFHKRAHVVRFPEALGWTVLWFLLAAAFAGALALANDQGETALQFVAGYLIELSLSMDNVFVIVVVFAYFHVAPQFQHRVLFWGILGALVMRGLMIGVGASLVSHAHWVLYLFGLFLLGSGIKMAVGKPATVQPESHLLIRLTRKLYPVSGEFDGQNFFTRLAGRRALTPLALVLVMVETTDLLFALDSIPAIFAVTERPFIIFTSNVFAILGLRSLYFVLAGAIQYFRFLKLGLAVVLTFIGAKMLLAKWYALPTEWSLAVVAGIFFLSIAVSALVAWFNRR